MDSSPQLIVTPSEEDQARAVWDACLDHIRESVNTQSFKTWFEPMVPLHLRGGKLTVQVPSQFFYDWLEEHYYTVISQTIETVLGKEAHLEYSVRTDEPQIDLDYQVSPSRFSARSGGRFPPSRHPSPSRHRRRLWRGGAT
jgi:chromosomal replication initiator protein